MATVVLIGFVIGFLVTFGLVKMNVNRKWIGWITAGFYGGFIGAGNVSIIDPWPAWFICLMSIVVFVILQELVQKWIEKHT